MLKKGVRLRVPVRSLLLFGSLLLLPAWARADDMSLAGDSGCTDPSIGPSMQFSFSSNSSGGLCLAFGNHSGTSFSSLRFTTSIPDTNGNPMLCSGGQFFANCDYVLDTLNDTLTVDFFGLDDRHLGIPVAANCSLTIDCLPPNNFSINLNNPVCVGNVCSQPTSDLGAGDWLKGGAAETFTGVANVPEPTMLPLLLVGFGALLARAKMLGNRNP